MKDTWNPWHGCKKISPGCLHCYMYFLDQVHQQDGSRIFKVKSDFLYPLQKNRDGSYKVKSGSKIRVCMTSDFFLEEADIWRNEVYSIIEKRKDVLFWLLTKRIERVSTHMPKYLDNIYMNVTCENQEMADIRIPKLLELPFLYRGIMVAPMIGPVDIEKYLQTGKINSVLVDGENYDGDRILDYQWVYNLYEQCVKYNVHFEFFGTGNYLKKNNKIYHIPREKQKVIAFKSGLYHEGKRIHYKLCDYQSEQLSLFDFNDDNCSNCQRKSCYKCNKRR